MTNNWQKLKYCYTLYPGRPRPTFHQEPFSAPRPATPSTMWRQRFRIRRASLRTSSASSLPASNWRLRGSFLLIFSTKQKSRITWISYFGYLWFKSQYNCIHCILCFLSILFWEGAGRLPGNVFNTCILVSVGKRDSRCLEGFWAHSDGLYSQALE